MNTSKELDSLKADLWVSKKANIKLAETIVSLRKQVAILEEKEGGVAKVEGCPKT